MLNLSFTDESFDAIRYSKSIWTIKHAMDNSTSIKRKSGNIWWYWWYDRHFEENAQMLMVYTNVGLSTMLNLSIFHLRSWVPEVLHRLAGWLQHIGKRTRFLAGFFTYAFYLHQWYNRYCVIEICLFCAYLQDAREGKMTAI